MQFCNKQVFEKIDAYIAANKERILDDLLTLMKIPSVQGAAEPGAPFGRACAKMLDETTKMYESHGFGGAVHPSGKYAISYYNENKVKTIGIFSHGDVVSADGEWLFCRPFEPVIRDGYIFGRGCTDDKSGIIETIYAAEIIRELGLDLQSRLLMFTGGNEETGMADIEAYVEQEIMPDASLVPDGWYPSYCGERTMFKFTLTSKNTFKTIKKFYGGHASNIILGEATAEIDYDEALWEQILAACKGNENFAVSRSDDTITVVARGISAHVASAENSKNAGMVLANLLLGCDTVSENDRGILSDVSRFLNDAQGTEFGIPFKDAVFGKLACGNGIIKTTDSGELLLDFDVRVGLSYDIDEMRKQIQKMTECDWNYKENRCSPGYYTPENSPIRKVIEETYAAVSGISDAKSVKTAGGTYSRKLKNAISVGKVGHYKAPHIEMPVGHGGAHQPDEKMSVDGFLEGIKIMVCMIMELDAMLNA